MVFPRERSRPARRRIAGERSRPAGSGPAPEAPAHPPTPEAADTAAPDEHLAPTPEEVPDERAVPEGVPDQRVVPEEEVPAEEEAAEEEAGVPADRPTESGAPAARTAERDPGDWPPTWVPAVLAALLVAALALDGFLFWKQQRDQEAAERALHSAVTVAPSVAERAAEAVLSYRYNTADKDVAEARRYLSSGYAPDYIASIRDVVSTPAREIGAVVQAQVLDSGVVEAGAERSDVLLFVNQTTTSAADTQSQTALNRVVFTMVPRGGTWKVDEIQAF